MMIGNDDRMTLQMFPSTALNITKAFYFLMLKPSLVKPQIETS